LAKAELIYEPLILARAGIDASVMRRQLLVMQRMPASTLM
jgi:hypothetical protein